MKKLIIIILYLLLLAYSFLTTSYDLWKSEEYLFALVWLIVSLAFLLSLVGFFFKVKILLLIMMICLLAYSIYSLFGFIYVMFLDPHLVSFLFGLVALFIFIPIHVYIIIFTKKNYF